MSHRHAHAPCGFSLGRGALSGSPRKPHLRARLREDTDSPVRVQDPRDLGVEHRELVRVEVQRESLRRFRELLGRRADDVVAGVVPTDVVVGPIGGDRREVRGQVLSPRRAGTVTHHRDPHG